MTENLVTLNRHNATAWLTLNRATAMNALSFELVEALLTHLHTLERDDSVRVIVLTGSGRAFCAGADLKNLNEQRAPGEADILDRVVELLEAVRAFPKPVIAAVNGLALAGGMELMLCCDLIYASDSARIGDAHFCRCPLPNICCLPANSCPRSFSSNTAW
jgi:enoyl-CoA hydratase/carnithine racemase